MRMCLIAPAAVVTLAAAAAPAQGASRVIIRGAGFGHGVGMSQYGAYGFAKRGRDHAFILAHYYSGTQLGKLDGPSEVRVLLRSAGADRRSAARRRVAGGAPAGSGADLRRDARAGRRRRCCAPPSGRDLGTYQPPLRVTGAPGGRPAARRARPTASPTGATAATSSCARGALGMRRSTP